MTPLEIIISIIGSSKDSNFLSFPDSPCIFWLKITPVLGQVSSGPFSFRWRNEWLVGPSLTTLVSSTLDGKKVGLIVWCLISYFSMFLSCLDNSRDWSIIIWVYKCYKFPAQVCRAWPDWAFPYLALTMMPFWGWREGLLCVGSSSAPY